MIDFGSLLRRAWEICWQNRWLFLLGMLAALGSATSGGNGAFTYSFGGDDVGPEFERQAAEFLRTLVAAWPYVLLGSFLLTLLAVLLWLLRLAARGGLIAAAAALDGKAEGAGELVTFGAALRRGARHLPRLAGLDLLLYGPLLLLILIPVVVVLVLTVGPAVAILEGRSTDVIPAGIIEAIVLTATCLCLVACVAFVWQAFLAFLHPMAQRSVVLADSGVISAIRHGWRILTRNPGDIMLLVLFLFVIGVIFRALLAAIFVPVGFLLFVPTFIDLFQGGVPSLGQIANLGVWSFLLALLAQVLSGFYVAYQSVSYTLGYRRLTEQSKVIPASSLPPATPYQFEQLSEE